MIERRGTLIPVLALIIIGALIESCECMRFDLQRGHMKCFSEDMKSESISTGSYHVVKSDDGAALPDTHKITVRVTSGNGKKFHHLAKRVEAGRFGFTAYLAAHYTACIWLDHDKAPDVVTVDFEWRTGVAAKEWGAVAKQGTVLGMEIELKKLMDTVSSIHDEMFYLRASGIEMQGLNSSTNSQMFWLSFSSLFVCFSVASLQFWHLKTFFVRKKML